MLKAILFFLLILAVRPLYVPDGPNYGFNVIQVVRSKDYTVYRNGPFIHAIAGDEKELFEVRGHMLPNGKMRLVLFNQNGYMDTWDYPHMPDLHNLLGKER